ncbi:hypothetical protein SRHO_G00170160 [Serrasalmus rhombeus]
MYFWRNFEKSVEFPFKAKAVYRAHLCEEPVEWLIEAVTGEQEEVQPPTVAWRRKRLTRVDQQHLFRRAFQS